MFPAIQQNPSTLQIKIENSPLLQAIGFDCTRFLEEGLLILPDVTVLNYRWNKLRENDLTLPKLEFVELHGTADDQSFIKIFRDGKISISNDEEFMHDLSIHVAAAVCLFENSNDLYRTCTNLFHTLVDALSEALELLEQAPDSVNLDMQRKRLFCQMLWTGLGMTVDNFTAQSNFLNCIGIIKNLSKFLELQWKLENNDPWWSYMQKRYGAAFENNQENLQNMWHYLVENVAQSSFNAESAQFSFNAESAWKVIES